MSKYIDAEKLIAEIKRRMEMHRKASADGYIIDPNRLDEDEDILSLIASLQQEQPEVDLEKEIEKHIESFGWGKTKHLAEKELINCTARHFYDLGLNARKED